MKRVREWARRQGGITMENHLIGEVVPASDLTPETIAAADVIVVGYSADEGVGAEGERRRQVCNPEAYPDFCRWQWNCSE